MGFVSNTLSLGLLLIAMTFLANVLDMPTGGIRCVTSLNSCRRSYTSLPSANNGS